MSVLSIDVSPLVVDCLAARPGCAQHAVRQAGQREREDTRQRHEAMYQDLRLPHQLLHHLQCRAFWGPEEGV